MSNLFQFRLWTTRNIFNLYDQKCLYSYSHVRHFGKPYIYNMKDFL